MTVNLLTTPVIAPLNVPADSDLLPDGDAMLDGFLADAGTKATKALKGATGSKGAFVSFQPAGWTMGGQVD